MSLGNIAGVVKSVSGLFKFLLFLNDCSEVQATEDCGIRCELQLNMQGSHNLHHIYGMAIILPVDNMIESIMLD